MAHQKMYPPSRTQWRFFHRQYDQTKIIISQVGGYDWSNDRGLQLDFNGISKTRDFFGVNLTRFKNYNSNDISFLLSEVSRLGKTRITRSILCSQRTCRMFIVYVTENWVLSSSGFWSQKLGILVVQGPDLVRENHILPHHLSCKCKP